MCQSCLAWLVLLPLLVQATVPPCTSHIDTYDFDNRVQKTVGSITTYYVVDDRNPSGYAQVLEEWDSINSQALTFVRAYTFGTDMISLRQADGTTRFYGYDGHGSTRFLTDSVGAITDTYTYDAFGILIAQTGDTPNDYLYAGEQHDRDLGLVYLRARYMNANTGRFWTMDSFEGNHEDPISLHKYLYAHADPINKLVHCRF